jgi:hypothetical protein
MKVLLSYSCEGLRAREWMQILWIVRWMERYLLQIEIENGWCVMYVCFMEEWRRREIFLLLRRFGGRSCCSYSDRFDDDGWL